MSWLPRAEAPLGLGLADSWQGTWLRILHLPVVTQAKQLWSSAAFRRARGRFLCLDREGSMGVFVAGVGGIPSGG